LEIDRSDSFGP